MKGKIIYEMSTTDIVYEYLRSVYIVFNGKRNTLSISPLNGGYRENLKYIFNQDGKDVSTGIYLLKASNYLDHLTIVSNDLGLNPMYASRISTAAFMENISIVEKEYKGLKITALSTGSTEINGGRVGDPSTYDERFTQKVEKEHGTINIILVIDAHLPPGTITRALVTCTEAKTAALQELLVGSKYSRGLATGTGSDGCILIGNLESPIKLTFAGKHSKLGEIIGLGVKESVKEALSKESNITPISQFSMLRRLERYEISEEALWNLFKERSNNSFIKRKQFQEELYRLNKTSALVIYSSLIFHIIDQFSWKLIQKQDVKIFVNLIFLNILEAFQIDKNFIQFNFEEKNLPKSVVEKFMELIVKLMEIRFVY